MTSSGLSRRSTYPSLTNRPTPVQARFGQTRVLWLHERIRRFTAGVNPAPRLRDAHSEAWRITGRLTEITMDIEHINGIGTLLTDLAARTEQLRGYL